MPRVAEAGEKGRPVEAGHLQRARHGAQLCLHDRQEQMNGPQPPLRNCAARRWSAATLDVPSRLGTTGEGVAVGSRRSSTERPAARRLARYSRSSAITITSYSSPIAASTSPSDVCGSLAIASNR